MIVLHAAPITWPAIGGLRMSIPGLVAAQNRLEGVDAAMVVTAADAGRPPQVEFPIFDQKIFPDSAGRLNLPAPFDRPDMVVFHSTYIPIHAAIAARLWKAGIPYVICPRGGMTRYAQRYRWWKKKIANLLFFNRMVARGAALNCLTHGEAAASSRWNRPIFVVGNGIRLPTPSGLASPGQSAHLRLVFIGRLQLRYKGLDVLLDACSVARSALLRAGAAVELYGPDCDGSSKALARRIARRRLQDVVTLHGPVVGKAKSTVLKQADVFLLFSRSEGHPAAVLEALAHGVPCLLTPHTNMAETVASAGAGWQVEPSAAGIAAALEEVLLADKKRLRLAGANAHRLAAETYSWDKIAALSVEAYRRYAA